MKNTPHKAEEVINNFVMQITAAALPAGLAATVTDAAGPLVVAAAAAFPVLLNSLPAKRQTERFQEWQRKVSEDLVAMKDRLDQLTDEQYHLINEVISAASQTINPEKLAYLRSAVRNSPLLKDLASQEASLLARIVRDTSAQEADFISENFSYQYVFVSNVAREEADTLTVRENSNESLIVQGLEASGVLEFGMATAGGGNFLKFSQITPKLLVLLQSP
ncbi:MAG: hypothetical protein RR855_00520 [Comamonas sp.]